MLGIGKDGSSPQPAHRVSWALHNGPIPPGIQILHKCDNPPCVRPTHLKLGTGKDNIQDMIRKGRDANTRAPRPYHNGSENPAAKLTEEDIIAIRKEYAKGNVTHQILAERYGTSQTNIHLIVHRLKWKHI